MTAPAVSVVMPIYKPDFLAAAIESVLAQTMRDFELILINDGSPHKRTGEIAAAFAAEDLRVRYLQQENKGVAAARNAGVAAACAPYIMLVDDDDISVPERAESQLCFLQANPQVAAVACRLLFSDANGELREDRSTSKQPATVIKKPPPLGDKPILGYAACWMLRREAYIEIGGMREYFRQAEDHDFNCRLEEKFTVALAGPPLYHYRVGNNPRQQTANPIGVWYLCVSRGSAYCRRNGKPDIIDNSPPPVETLLINATAKGCMPPRAVRQAAKKMLLQKRYKFLRVLLAADKSSRGFHWNLRLKLVYWSLTKNRLGYWFFTNGKNLL